MTTKGVSFHPSLGGPFSAVIEGVRDAREGYDSDGTRP
jgi:hypothetical protein